MSKPRLRDTSLTIRLTKAEKERIERNAKRAERSITDYRRMFKGSYNRKYDDYICVDQLGGLIRPNRVTQRFADLIKQYGLRKIRFHDLRHTFASILINQDVPLLNVSTFLGHSDLSTTANIYAHLDKSKKQESADVISSIFNKAKE